MNQLSSVQANLQQNQFDLPDAENLFDYIEAYKSDEGFEPSFQCQPTTIQAGGMAKAEIIAQRLQRSEELWHPDDPKVEAPISDYDLLIGPEITDEGL